MTRFISLAILLFSSATFANTLVPIVESQEGDRLLAVVETFEIKP